MSRPTKADNGPNAPDAYDARLRRAERQGLRLAILCRTVAAGIGFVWLIVGWSAAGYSPSPWALVALFAFTVLGVVALAVIGTRLDRWWLKYAIYTADILGVCALFVVMPVSRSGDVPQIIAFRAFGIYYLFPLIAMACLSLSWRLVAWSGLVTAGGWWAAFALAIGGMERQLSWGDMSDGAGLVEYESIFLSIDFVGFGNRIEETGFILTAALILALAVYRARQVFFAQIAAEAEREAERAARERIALTLGRYVPEAVATRLIADPSALTPQVRKGAVLLMDIKDFTAFAAAHEPEEVISRLNGFLAGCAERVGDHGGVVITFTGDGLLATFNTPLEIADPERAALAAAKALIAASTGSGFTVRVGLAAGAVAAGSVGSSDRQAFTVYGDTVNRAARLEALAKDVGEAILLDDAIARAADKRDRLRSLGPKSMKGLAAPVTVWALPT